MEGAFIVFSIAPTPRKSRFGVTTRAPPRPIFSAFHRRPATFSPLGSLLPEKQLYCDTKQAPNWVGGRLIEIVIDHLWMVLRTPGPSAKMTSGECTGDMVNNPAV
ncbi:MAG: hypothetical protein [Circular genetic element sp.]|nr:MAG: hypothetical protein [Circular genetic element sp.]